MEIAKARVYVKPGTPGAKQGERGGWYVEVDKKNIGRENIDLTSMSNDELMKLRTKVINKINDVKNKIKSGDSSTQTKIDLNQLRDFNDLLHKPLHEFYAKDKSEMYNKQIDSFSDDEKKNLFSKLDNWSNNIEHDPHSNDITGDFPTGEGKIGDVLTSMIGENNTDVALTVLDHLTDWYKNLPIEQQNVEPQPAQAEEGGEGGNEPKPKMNKNDKYLKMFFDEKDIPTQNWEMKDSQGNTHIISNDVVIDNIKSAPDNEKEQIISTLRKIDFHNGDVNHFLKFLGQQLINTQFSKSDGAKFEMPSDEWLEETYPGIGNAGVVQEQPTTKSYPVHKMAPYTKKACGPKYPIQKMVEYKK